MDNMNEYFSTHLIAPASHAELDSLCYRVNNMSYDEVCSIYREVRKFYNRDYDYEAVERLSQHIKRVKVKLEGGNKPIKQLIKEFKNASCKEDAEEIADELYERFDKQSFEEQRLIMKTLIKTDYRHEAYYRLNNTWGEMVVKDLQRHWLKWGDDQPIIYIIRFSSEEFLVKHAEKLSSAGDIEYLELCLRLANNPKFVIEEHRFYSKCFYYALLYKLDRGIDKEFLQRELFKTIEENLMDFPELYVDELLYTYSNYHDSNNYVSIRYLPNVRNAIHAMQSVGIKDELYYFYDWDSQIIRTLGEYAEVWSEENGEELTFYQRWMKYCELATDNFPTEYATKIKKRIEDHKQRQERVIEELKPFMEDFELELCDTPF